MARKEKHHVFSARTTGEGLKALNELKARLGVSWDALVIDAVCAHYGLDRAVLEVPPTIASFLPEKLPLRELLEAILRPD